MKSATITPTLKLRLIRAKQPASYLGISPWSLRDLVHGGIMPVVRHSASSPMLFDLSDLDSYISRVKQTTAIQ